MADRITDGRRHVWTQVKKDDNNADAFQKQVQIMERCAKITWKFHEHWTDGNTACLISLLFNGTPLSKFARDAHHIH